MDIEIEGDKLVYHNNSKVLAGALNRSFFIPIFLSLIVNELTMSMSSLKSINSTPYPLLALFAGMALFFLVARLIGSPDRTQRQVSLMSNVSLVIYGILAFLLPTTTALGADAILILPLGLLSYLVFFNDERFELQFTRDGLLCLKHGLPVSVSNISLSEINTISFKASKRLMFSGCTILIKKDGCKRPLLNLRITWADRLDPTNQIHAIEFFRSGMHKFGYTTKLDEQSTLAYTRFTVFKSPK